MYVNHKQVARLMSAPIRDLLIDHIDGPRQINVHDQIEVRQLAALLRGGLVSNGMHGPHVTQRPSTSTITENGQMVAAYVLAGYAESLIRAGYRVEAANSGAQPPLAKTARKILGRADGFPAKQAWTTSGEHYTVAPAGRGDSPP